MTDKFISFGEAYETLSPKNLQLDVSKKILKLCEISKDFEVIELRHLTLNKIKSELIIVDCINDQVPSRNTFGIKNRERLALVFTPDKLPEVRTLRCDFPICPHMNHVLPGEPASLCLYANTWQTLERSWTPQKHLQRILWWFTESAKGTLHQNDQELEPLYFESYFEIILPPDYDEKAENSNLVLEPELVLIDRLPSKFKVIRCKFRDKELLTPQKPPKKKIFNVPIIGFPSGKYRKEGSLLVPQEHIEDKEIPNFTILSVKIPSIVHGNIEQYPGTLGELYDQIEKRGVKILDILRNTVKERSAGGVSRDKLNTCLLILSIQMQRAGDSLPERSFRQAFHVNSDLANLGKKMGVLMIQADEKYYPTPLIGNTATNDNNDWREVKIFPIEVKTAVTSELAQIASDIDIQTASFKGVLAGVGALGSTIAELWAKEHWGEWGFIDPDILKSHNIIRHIAKDFHVGKYKADIVQNMVSLNYQDNYYRAFAIAASANNFKNEEVKKVISEANFFVDATTTIEVPRDISQNTDVPRAVSVFLTPSGKDSVLLLESSDRSIKLDSLEAQYYKFIINTEWGKYHLEGHKGNIRVGAGCRAVSVIISYEFIQFHASMLARQIRLLRNQPEAYVCVWSCNSETGAMSAYKIPACLPEVYKCGDWNVMIDIDLKEKISKTRMSQLPKETGGVIIGYIDQKLQNIYVVEMLNAPPDSDADQSGFTRGVANLKTELEEVRRRTAYMVDYIGEWHSHPPFISAYPSGIDRLLIQELAETLKLDGQPAVMIIVGMNGEVSVTVKEDDTVKNF
jgi:integrative and conjugative element protein (TIGR02256 family)